MLSSPPPTCQYPPHDAPTPALYCICRHLQTLINRVLSAGFLSGCAAALVFGLAKGPLIRLFTDDFGVISLLENGKVWWVLVASQPLNGLVFVYDGLMYASQSFTYIRNYMISGFVLTFLPVILFEMFYWPGLTGIWLAKVALNVWRAAGAAYLIHYLFMREFDAELLPIVSPRT